MDQKVREALEQTLAYMWADEHADHDRQDAAGQAGHIFNHLQTLRRYLDQVDAGEIRQRLEAAGVPEHDPSPFHRYTITYTVLTDRPAADLDDVGLLAAMLADDFVGEGEVTSEETLTPDQMARALTEMGSEPGFFGLDEGDEL